MHLNEEQQGEVAIFIQTILWGLFPVITILSLKTISPVITLGISSLFASLLFAVLLSAQHKWHDVLNTSVLKDILLATLILGVGYYLLYFIGLQYTSAGNASIVALTEIFFSFLFFNVWKKDPLPIQHMLGAGLMLIGAFIVFYPNLRNFQLGDVLVLSAAFIAPFGNLFSIKARKQVSSESIMFIRSFVSAVVLLLFASFWNMNFSYHDLQNSLVLLLINGVFFMGFSKILWIEGIHRISVVKACALSSMSPVITIFFAWVFLQNDPTIWQLLSFIPMFIGVILLSMKKRRNKSTFKFRRLLKFSTQ